MKKSPQKHAILLVSILLGIAISFTIFRAKSKLPEKKTIYLSGINYYLKKDFSLVKSTLENIFKVDCIVLETTTIFATPLVIDSDILQRQSKNSPYFDYSGGDICIHITNSNLVCGEIDIRGVSYGDDIYIENRDIKITSIHELSHSFGLEHCENICIMNPYSTDKWNESIDRPIFCDNCKYSLPIGLLRK